MKTFKAVLFDLDGTIARTMEAYFEAWRFSCNEFGFEISEEDYYPLEGMDARELAKTLCKKTGGEENDNDIEKIIEIKKDYFIKIFQGRRADLYNGAEKLLNSLKYRNVPIALVTASVSEQVEASIPKIILEKFDTIVTGEIAGRGKPFPDPYLKAAEFLGVDPKECVAVENAPLGVKSVKSAGMYCIAVAHTVSKEKLKDADEVVESIAEIKI